MKTLRRGFNFELVKRKHRNLRIILRYLSPSSVPQEAHICQLLAAQLAAEALRMPRRIHRLYHSSDDEFVCKNRLGTFLENETLERTAFSAARSVENVEVMFAVLPSLELEIDSIGERLEALCAAEIRKFNQYMAEPKPCGRLQVFFLLQVPHGFHPSFLHEAFSMPDLTRGVYHLILERKAIVTSEVGGIKGGSSEIFLFT